MRILTGVLILILAASPAPVQAQKRRGGRLKAGDAAVAFHLQQARDGKTVKLSDLKGKPVVLIFGSSTSTRLVESVDAIDKLHATCKDSVHLFVVYIRESPGRKQKGDVPVHKTLAQRRQVANAFARRVKLSVPVLVDTMDNKADDAFAGWPDRIYIIDAAGKVVLKSNYTLDGFGPALSAAPFVLSKLTGKTISALSVPGQRSRKPKEGDQAPQFTLQDTQGKTTVKLSDLKGRPVVLVFGSCT